MSAAYEATPPTGAVPEAPAPAATSGVGAPTVALFGLLTMVISAWAGIVPYVGPLFGYRADGTGAWVWNLAHALLALVPGAIGVLAGASMLSAAGRVRYGLGRLSMTTAGLLAAACGAWFVIGPTAWRVLESANYFAPARPSALLANQVGYSFGPGVLLALFGGAAIGWALRHRNVAPLGLRARNGGVPRHLAAVQPPVNEV